MTTVKTKEILETLDIDSTPLTMELMFEREQAIEDRWLEEFRQQEDRLRERIEAQQPLKFAHAKIGEAARATLRTKGVVISDLYSHTQVAVIANAVTNATVNASMQLPDIDDNAVIESVDATVTYITMGRDFEVILQAIKDNPTLMSEWERFMLMLRMATDD